MCPPLRNVRNRSIYHDAETPPRCRSLEKTKTNTDRDVTSPRNTFHIHQDDESIPPAYVSSPDWTLPNRDGGILPNSNTFRIHQDDENIPPPSSRDTTIPSKGILPPNNVLRNNDIHCEAENIPPPYGRDMTLPNRGGSNPPLGNFRNTYTHDAENIPPPPHNTHDSTTCKDPQVHYDSRGMTVSNEGCMLSREIKNEGNFQRLVAEKDSDVPDASLQAR